MPSSRLVLVAGTHGWSQDWWRPSSPFVSSRPEGYPLVSANDPFYWDTDLGGLAGSIRPWMAAGAALRWYLKAHGVPMASAVTHSHGWQALAYAAAQGQEFDVVYSVGAPVREDMQVIYEAARRHVRYWVHVHSDAADVWQALGEFDDGHIGIRRAMSLADVNIYEPLTEHSHLIVPDLWTKRGWWSFLTTKGLTHADSVAL